MRPDKRTLGADTSNKKAVCSAVGTIYPGPSGDTYAGKREKKKHMMC